MAGKPLNPGSNVCTLGLVSGHLSFPAYGACVAICREGSGEVIAHDLPCPLPTALFASTLDLLK